MPDRSRGVPSLSLLVLRAQTGDERAFSALFEQFGDKTMRYLRGMLGDDADDVQQELWLAVYKGVAALADPSAFRTWLFRSTRHRAIDWLRGKKRERELFDDVELYDVPDDAPGEDAYVLDDAGSGLSKALAAIPPPQREVILLKYRDEMSYE